MKILVALNSFKGSCSSIHACQAMKKGLIQNQFFKQVQVFPLCDGGDDSINVLSLHLAVAKVNVTTTDALGNRLIANYLWNKKRGIAYVELAVASGIVRLRTKPNQITIANTAGTGKIINHALKKGASKIVLLVGGSATNDAGIGILNELGVRFYDKEMLLLDPIPANLARIHSIDDSTITRWTRVKFEVWTDVLNPFDGPEGAVAIYSRQKGASDEDQKLLEEGMIHFRKIISRKYNIDLNRIPGTGAAGGVGGGLLPVLKAKIRHGTSEILSLTHFRNTLKQFDMVITGEGSLDLQSGYGKLVQGVIKEARRARIPVIGVCGSCFLTSAQLKKIGFDAIFTLVPGPISLDIAMNQVKKYLQQLGFNLAGLIGASAIN